MSDLEHIRVMLREEMEPIRDEVRGITHLLTGNGEPEKGMIVRMDRMEQTEKRRQRVIQGIGTGVLGSIGAALWALFK